MREKDGAVLIDIHVVPNAKRSEIVGRHGDALKVRIAAPPVDGAANEEVCRFFAKVLGVKKSAVAVVKGLTSKAKTVAVSGVSLANIRSAINTDPVE